jgi:hypothetical protein
VDGWLSKVLKTSSAYEVYRVSGIADPRLPIASQSCDPRVDEVSPLMNGASEKRSELDQTRSPDFKIRVAETIKSRVSSSPLLRALSLSIKKSASASFGLDASVKQPLPYRHLCAFPHINLDFMFVGSSFTSQGRGEVQGE